MTKNQIRTSNGSGQVIGVDALIWFLIATIIVAGIAVPLLLSGDKTEVIKDIRTQYTVGSLAEDDVVAKETFYYVDEVMTREKQQEAAAAVLPRFMFSLNNSKGMLNLIDLLALAFNTHKDDPMSAMTEVKQLLSDYGVQDAGKTMLSLASLTMNERNTVLNTVKETTSKLLTNGLYDQEELELIEQQGYTQFNVMNSVSQSQLPDPLVIEIQSVVTLSKLERTLFVWFKNYGSFLSVNQNVLAMDILSLILRPNVIYDGIGTSIARQEASGAIDPVTVKVESGQYLLKKDFVVTEQDIRTLQAMVLSTMQYSLLEQIGRIFFVCFITAASLFALDLMLKDSPRKKQFLLIFLVGVLLTQITSYFVLRFLVSSVLPTYDPFLPVLVLPIFMSLITSRKQVGLVASVMLGSYAVLLPNSTIATVFFIIAEGFCGIHFIRYVSKRIDMLFQWFFGAVTTSFIVLVNNLLLGFAFDRIFALISAMIINVTLAYIVVTALLPLIEKVFNIPTTFRLRELAFGDSPILIRLSRNAQGTYNHVQVVADLAYAAAMAVGADPLLARVGALYHDIGKLDHPEYFIENQSGDNKHDDLKATLSVAIIKSHVKIGVEKGRDTGLPQEVLDIISQHHGNDIIPFFLKEAQDEASSNGNTTQVNTEDFSYNSVPPQTPEAAIVMLSDCVEAASRSIRKPTIQKFERLIDQIVMGKIERKQLSASHLSLTDIDRISQSFIQTLVGRYHTRIEYPDTVTEQEVRQ